MPNAAVQLNIPGIGVQSFDSQDTADAFIKTPEVQSIIDTAMKKSAANDNTVPQALPAEEKPAPAPSPTASGFVPPKTDQAPDTKPPQAAPAPTQLVNPDKVASFTKAPVETTPKGVGERGGEVGLGSFKPSPYDDLIYKYAKENGVPPSLFKSQLWEESHLNPGAVGPMTKYGQAKGIGQLIDSTAKELGVTDPMDAEQNIRGSAKYLRKMYDRYGSWDMALAAYNAGPGNVDKYNGVPPFKETRAYVNNILGRVKEGWQGIKNTVEGIPGNIKSGLNDLESGISDLGNKPLAEWKDFLPPGSRFQDWQAMMGGALNTFGKAVPDIAAGGLALIRKSLDAGTAQLDMIDAIHNDIMGKKENTNVDSASLLEYANTMLAHGQNWLNDQSKKIGAYASDLENKPLELGGVALDAPKKTILGTLQQKMLSGGSSAAAYMTQLGVLQKLTGAGALTAMGLQGGLTSLGQHNSLPGAIGAGLANVAMGGIFNKFAGLPLNPFLKSTANGIAGASFAIASGGSVEDAITQAGLGVVWGTKMNGAPGGAKLEKVTKDYLTRTSKDLGPIDVDKTIPGSYLPTRPPNMSPDRMAELNGTPNTKEGTYGLIPGEELGKLLKERAANEAQGHPLNEKLNNTTGDSLTDRVKEISIDDFGHDTPKKLGDIIKPEEYASKSDYVKDMGEKATSDKDFRQIYYQNVPEGVPGNEPPNIKKILKKEKWNYKDGNEIQKTLGFDMTPMEKVLPLRRAKFNDLEETLNGPTPLKHGVYTFELLKQIKAQGITNNDFANWMPYVETKADGTVAWNEGALQVPGKLDYPAYDQSIPKPSPQQMETLFKARALLDWMQSRSPSAGYLPRYFPLWRKFGGMSEAVLGKRSVESLADPTMTQDRTSGKWHDDIQTDPAKILIGYAHMLSSERTIGTLVPEMNKSVSQMLAVGRSDVANKYLDYMGEAMGLPDPRYARTLFINDLAEANKPLLDKLIAQASGENQPLADFIRKEAYTAMYRGVFMSPRFWIEHLFNNFTMGAGELEKYGQISKGLGSAIAKGKSDGMLGLQPGTSQRLLDAVKSRLYVPQGDFRLEMNELMNQGPVEGAGRKAIHAVATVAGAPGIPFEKAVTKGVGPTMRKAAFLSAAAEFMNEPNKESYINRVPMNELERQTILDQYRKGNDFATAVEYGLVKADRINLFADYLARPGMFRGDFMKKIPFLTWPSEAWNRYMAFDAKASGMDMTKLLANKIATPMLIYGLMSAATGTNQMGKMPIASVARLLSPSVPLPVKNAVENFQRGKYVQAGKSLLTWVPLVKGMDAFFGGSNGKR